MLIFPRHTQSGTKLLLQLQFHLRGFIYRVISDIVTSCIEPLFTLAGGPRSKDGMYIYPRRYGVMRYFGLMDLSSNITKSGIVPKDCVRLQSQAIRVTIGFMLVFYQVCIKYKIVCYALRGGAVSL